MKRIIAAHDRPLWEALWPHGYARSSPNRALSEDTFFSDLAEPLSTQEYKPCDGPVSHPGGVEVLLVASCYRKWPN